MTARNCLITGGARRVGRGMALRLAEAGYNVAITYHQSTAEAQSLVREVEALGRRAIAIRADLTEPEQSVPAVVEAVTKQMLSVDLLVNNASIYEPSGLHDASMELRRRLWSIHVEAPYLLARGFADRMPAGGCIVNMVDLLAERPWGELMYYCATKAALVNLTLGLAKDLAAKGIRVNGIAPGVVEWPADYPEAEREKYLKRVPLGRAGRPEDVAEAVFFLAEHAPYMTGQIVRLDGGRSIT